MNERLIGDIMVRPKTPKKTKRQKTQSKSPGFRDRGINIILANPLSPDGATEFWGRRRGGQLGYVHDAFRIVFLFLYYAVVFWTFVMINFFSNGIILSSLDSLIGSNFTYYFPYLTISPLTWFSTWWKTGAAKFYAWGWEDDDFALFGKKQSKGEDGDGDGEEEPGEKDAKKPQLKVSEQVMNLFVIVFVTIAGIMVLRKFLPDIVSDIYKRFKPVGDGFPDLGKKQVKDIIEEMNKKSDNEKDEIILQTQNQMKKAEEELNEATATLQLELEKIRATRKESKIKMSEEDTQMVQELEDEAEAKIDEVTTVIAAVNIDVDTSERKAEDNVERVAANIEKNIKTIRQAAEKRQRKGAGGVKKKRKITGWLPVLGKRRRRGSKVGDEQVQKKRKKLASDAQETATVIEAKVEEATDVFKWEIDETRSEVQTILGTRMRTEMLEQQREQVERSIKRLTDYGKYQRVE